jgi:uncharacterized protein (DUF2267 family)
MTVSNLVRLHPVTPPRAAYERAPISPTSPEAAAFYQAVQEAANLPTVADARRWTHAILRTLGELLNRPARRALAFALPPELAAALLEAPGPRYARNPQLPLDRFLRTAALRSGATDAAAALQPVRTTFELLRAQLQPDVARRVAGSLPPEVAVMWDAAQPVLS